MDKTIIKKIIVENQERILKLRIYDRKISFEQNANYILTGQRRAGKTFLLYHRIIKLIQEGIEPNRILYINFEDERLLEFTTRDFDLILESFKELYQHSPFIFFDEIQNIEAWEKFARRLADSDYKVYITGSNATMLSKEMATVLGGRFLIKEIETLSFPEFLIFTEFIVVDNIEFSEKRFKLKQFFDEWFKYGGYPELLKYQDKREYLNTVFLKIFLGDIITRHHIRNSFALKVMVKKLAESATDEISFNRIKHIIQSTGVKIGTTTVIEFMSYLEDSFLIKSISNYQKKLAEKETKKKYYFRDHGLLTLFLYDPSSLSLETIVFNHLIRQYKDAVYYIRNSYEVDFYIPDQQLIQVAYSLKELVTRERELKGLRQAFKTYPVKEAIIITMDEEEIINDRDITIKVIPVWKWLLM